MTAESTTGCNHYNEKSLKYDHNHATVQSKILKQIEIL